MRFISRSFHAVLDYLSGIVLLGGPWLFGFSDIVVARNAMVICGVLVLGMSPFTNYEGGIVKMVPMSTHLWADLFVGLFLATAPWLLFFDEEVFLPFLALGLFSMIVSLLTVSISQVKHHNPIEFVERGPR